MRCLDIRSLCAKGVKKTRPTTFDMKAKDLYPQSDIDILIRSQVSR